MHYLSHNWLIFYCIVLTLSLPHLLGKIKNKRLLLFVGLFYVSVCVFNFGSGLMMALDWQDPFAAGADPQLVGKAASSHGGKGGIIILIIVVLIIRCNRWWCQRLLLGGWGVRVLC